MNQSKKSLLYVEDDVFVRDIICSFIALRYPAVSIDSAGSADEGVELFVKKRHTVVMTDVNLDNSNGVAMARAIRNDVPETIIIFITGSSNVEQLAEFEKAGSSSVIIKPVYCDALFGILDQYFVRTTS